MELEFDKKEWVREFKTIKKDYIIEDRERYRPLLNIKKDIKDFFEEVEKEEKKSEIGIKKEFNGIYAQIQKHRQDVEQAKVILQTTKTDPTNLDRLHTKVRGIEQNLKGFKLKSRTAYDQLVDEEQLLMNEMEMWSQKFDAYSLEKSSV
jgi:hypothetical protein